MVGRVCAKFNWELSLAVVAKANVTGEDALNALLRPHFLEALRLKPDYLEVRRQLQQGASR